MRRAAALLAAAAGGPRRAHAPAVWEASAWLWLMPALLLRRPAPTVRAGMEEGAEDSQGRRLADVSAAAVVRSRLMLAEAGAWSES